MSYLDLDIIGTHNPKSIGIADITIYDSEIINTPTIEVIPPGFGKVSLPFVPREVNIFNSNNLKLSNSQTSEGLSILPDGIWKVKYSFAPATTNFINKKFLRVDALMQKYFQAFLSIDFSDCADNDGYCQKSKKEKEQKLREIELMINGAISAANRDQEIEAMQMYRRADSMIDRLDICKTCLN